MSDGCRFCLLCRIVKASLRMKCINRLRNVLKGQPFGVIGRYVQPAKPGATPDTFGNLLKSVREPISFSTSQPRLNRRSGLLKSVFMPPFRFCGGANERR